MLDIRLLDIRGSELRLLSDSLVWLGDSWDVEEIVLTLVGWHVDKEALSAPIDVPPSIVSGPSSLEAAVSPSIVNLFRPCLVRHNLNFRFFYVTMSMALIKMLSSSPRNIFTQQSRATFEVADQLHIVWPTR